MSEKRSTPAPETVTVPKNNFACPLPSFRPWALLNLFVDLVFRGSIFILFFSTYGRVNLVFYDLIILFQQTGRL